MDSNIKAALRISAIYLVLAGIWIFLSDRVLLLWVQSTQKLAELQTIKGFGFVFVMAVLLLIERWRQQSALAASEAQYRLLFDSYPQPMWVFDRHTFQILAVNDAAVRAYGYEREAFLKMPMLNLYLPAEQPRVKEMIMSDHGIQDQPAVMRHSTRDGTLIYVEATANPLPFNGRDALIMMAIDVTERKKVEAELSSTREFLENLLEHAPLPIFVDNMDNRLRLVNRAWKNFICLGQEDCNGMRLDEVFDPATAEQMITTNQIVARDGQPLFTDEILTGQDGVERTFHTVKFALRDAGGEVEAIAGVMVDITFRKQAEMQVQEAARVLERRVDERTAQLQDANRELEAFSYSISHDLRSPLRAMEGFSRIVLEEHSQTLSAEGQHYLGLIREGAREMSALIDDLLEFSRLSRQPVEKLAIDTTALVKECLAALESEMTGRNLEVVVHEMAACCGDPALLRQLWLNLLSNAVKFTRLEPHGRIDVGSEEQVGQTVFYVRDNGVGFDMRYADKLFGVFQRLHRADEFEGTGVGLAIVQRVVQRHGGRIWASAEPGKGAAFFFTLACDSND